MLWLEDLEPKNLQQYHLEIVLFFWQCQLGIGFSTAITPLIAESNAQRNFIKSKSILENSVTICIILGFLLTIGVFALKPLLNSMGQAPNVLSLLIHILTGLQYHWFLLFYFKASNNLLMDYPWLKFQWFLQLLQILLMFY